MKNTTGLPDIVSRTLSHQYGITSYIVARYRLAWDGQHVIVPIRRWLNEDVVQRQLRWQDNSLIDMGNGDKSQFTELYGSEHVHRPGSYLVVCDNVLDRLALEGKSIPAIALLGEPLDLHEDWVVAFSRTGCIFICFNWSVGARSRFLALVDRLPEARVINMPAESGTGGPADFFGRLKKSRRDFLNLLRHASARVADGCERPRRPDPTAPTNDHANRIRLRTLADLPNVVRLYLGEPTVLADDQKLRVNCPWHVDESESLLIDHSNQRYRCGVCGRSGDVVDFIENIDGVSTNEAMAKLEAYIAVSNETDGQRE